MFFCSTCARRKNWPESIFQSTGRCEVCGKTKACSDVPSSSLPAPVLKAGETLDISGVVL